MGFGEVIATLVSIAVLMTVAQVFISEFSTSTNILINSVKEMQDIKNEQLKTDINISSAYASGNYIYLNITNTGHEKIRDFPKIDVIVTDITTKNTYWIKYTNNATLSNKEWKKNYITPDDINPDSILDPDETMNVTIQMTSNPPYRVIIATPNGVGDSKYIP